MADETTALAEAHALEYPEHAKLLPVTHLSSSIGEFLDWLSAQGVQLMEWSVWDEETPCTGQMFGECTDGVNGYGRVCSKCKGTGKVTDHYEQWVHSRRQTTQLLADFFEIDLVKIEEEKRAMIESIRDIAAAEAAAVAARRKPRVSGEAAQQSE